MTVCIATLFNWNYAAPGDPPDLRLAAITASDQMITAGDVQYEPTQQKVALITPRCILLIAGDYSIHSEAIQDTERQIGSRVDATPQQIAIIYGQAIQRIQRRHAEDMILAPLGLNTDTFLAQQREMSDFFVGELKSELQRFQGHDVDALVVGTDGKHSHIYNVDSRGVVSCADDVAFDAIGAGAWHSKSYLMQTEHGKTSMYAQALAQTYSAKKRAETAPGVGSRTDIYVIIENGLFRLPEHHFAELERLYEESSVRTRQVATESIGKLGDYLLENWTVDSGTEASKNARLDEKAGDITAQIPRKMNEPDGAPEGTTLKGENRHGDEEAA